TQNNQQGFRWVNPQQQGQDGHLEITGKVRKAWGGQRPGVKQSKIKVVAYGALGQNIASQLRAGALLWVKGELSVKSFQYRQGPKAGQWGTNVEVQLRDGRNAEPSFAI